MDWFEQITGFRELNYVDTRKQLEVVNGRLHSKVNGKGFQIGDLGLVSLKRLRELAFEGGSLPGRLKVSIVRGDVRSMHSATEYSGAMFQVASQFNLLEMVSPEVTPEHGVTRYQNDPTQGPACAIAAGAATIFRNYFAMVDGQEGQTHDRQFDGLADMGKALCHALEMPLAALWSMRNGYAICSRQGLDAISAYLISLKPAQTDDLRDLLRIGVHSDVEVTEQPGNRTQLVSQAFCSALPVAYGRVPSEHWSAFGRLVLEGAYEATMWAAVLNAQRAKSNIVLLTRIGGGAFGNDGDWIDSAMRRALRLVADFCLDVRIVSYGTPSVAIQKIANDFE